MHAKLNVPMPKQTYQIDPDQFATEIVGYADKLGNGLSREHEKKLADEIKVMLRAREYTPPKDAKDAPAPAHEPTKSHPHAK